MNLYDFFPAHELACKCGQCGLGQAQMSPQFMERLIALRTELGFPLFLHSAYRCPEHNARQSKTGLAGPHTTGRAVDIAVSGTRAVKLMQAAARHGFTGFGVSQKGEHAKRFVHLDDLTAEDGFPRPTMWSY